MYWQTREILRRYNVVPDAQTLVVDLPRSNYLSGLLFHYEATNGATAGLVTLPSFLSALGIIADGSTELFSMDGADALLAGYGLTGKVLPANIAITAGTAVHFSGFIPFGRYLGDPNFYLDCSRYASLEARITFAPTVAATGIATGSQYFTIYGIMAMESAPGPRQGTFKTSRKYRFTSAASGDVVLDLPRGNFYRKLLIADIGAGQVLSTGYSRIALDVNNGEKILFAGDTKGLRKLIDVLSEEQLLVTDTVATGPLTTFQPPGAIGDILTIPFDVGKDMMNCLNSAQFGAIKLTLTQAAASHVTSVILQEILS
jgi:hypothetical protein